MLHKLTHIKYYGSIQQWIFPLLFYNISITYIHHEKKLFNWIITDNCREFVGNKHLLHIEYQYSSKVRYSPQFNSYSQRRHSARDAALVILWHINHIQACS